ncbi:MAG: S-methyl-5'-thioinosine phosphorylase [Betaproteobacteria bacterium]|jgi:5'-methylthioadenosine phosphorylase|nr:S-methyl-5'-thioinosine phosphorylase [Betaproteobacteria bacterium]
MLAIIGGSGLTKLATIEDPHRRVVRTPYGEPSGALTFGRLCGREVVFLPRHGHAHSIAPHEVNYRANIWALREEKATAIVSVASVGGIRADLAPGVLAVPHQIIDYTHGRRGTFFEGPDQPVTHVDFTEPYCPVLRAKLLAAATAAGEAVFDGGVYAVTQGPRLETAAEIDRLERDGAEMVGMTGMPEAVLARELGLSYAALSVVANFAAGRGNSAHEIDLKVIGAILEEAMQRVSRILDRCVECHDS